MTDPVQASIQILRQRTREVEGEVKALELELDRLRAAVEALELVPCSRVPTAPAKTPKSKPARLKRKYGTFSEARAKALEKARAASRAAYAAKRAAMNGSGP